MGSPPGCFTDGGVSRSFAKHSSCCEFCIMGATTAVAARWDSYLSRCESHRGTCTALFYFARCGVADDRVDTCNPDDCVSHALLKEAIPLACG